LNSFVEYLTEELWDNKVPVGKGPAYKIVDYMKLPKDMLEPIMTNSENIIQFGPNAYSKPSTGLNILRETIMGRESFDYAFKEYARRWAFKHPTPADLFRTMEDASAEDLDWFWRGWFYGTEACDISLDTVKWAVLNTEAAAAPNNAGSTTRKIPVAKPMLNNFDDISKIRNRDDKKITFATDADPSLRDFYWRYARGQAKVDTTAFEVTIPAAVADNYSEAERFKIAGDKNLYELTFSNENKVVKTFMKDKEVVSILLDPLRETADINTDNNTWPSVTTPSKFQLFKTRTGPGPRGAAGGNGNAMQKEIK
jgi:aminopeptidase N